MALPSSGDLSLEDVQNEFAGNYRVDDTSSLSKAYAFYFGDIFAEEPLSDFLGKGIAQSPPISGSVIDRTVFPFPSTADSWNNLSGINASSVGKATNTGTTTTAAAVSIPMDYVTGISGTVQSIMVQLASVSRSSLGFDGQSRAPNSAIHLITGTFSGSPAPLNSSGLFPRTNVGFFRTQTYYPTLASIGFDNAGFISNWNAGTFRLAVTGSTSDVAADITKLDSNDELEIYFARIEVLYSTI